MEVIFTQTSDPEKKTKPQFLKYCNFCQKCNNSVSSCFRKQWEAEERKLSSYSGSKSPAKIFNQIFKAYQNPIHPNENPSSYPVNYYSRRSYESRNRSSSRDRYSPYRSFRFRSPSTSQRSPENSRSRYCYRDRGFNFNRTPSRSRYTEFRKQRRNCRSS